MPPLNFLPTLRPANFSDSKKEDIFKLETLFQYFTVLILIYMISRLVYYFTTSEEDDWVLIITIPIAILLITLIIMIVVSLRIRRLCFTKNKINRYIYYFDMIKALIYGVITVVLIEFKLLDPNFKTKEATTPLFWLSAELAIIVWPTILSLQTKIMNIFVLAFHFLYIYLRFEGFKIEVIEAGFWFVKVFPLIFYLYKLKMKEKNKENDKTKQKEERKFASKVLNILPEGVAIVDETGLQYMNDSMRTIMRVKDDQCLETLFTLENTQYNDENNTSGVIKKSVTSSHEITKRNELGLRRGDSRSPSIFARLGETGFKFPENSKSSSPTRLTKRSTNSLIPKNVTEKIILTKAKSLNYKPIGVSDIKVDLEFEGKTKNSPLIDRKDDYEEGISLGKDTHLESN